MLYHNDSHLNSTFSLLLIGSPDSGTTWRTFGSVSLSFSLNQWLSIHTLKVCLGNHQRIIIWIVGLSAISEKAAFSGLKIFEILRFQSFCGSMDTWHFTRNFWAGIQMTSESKAHCRLLKRPIDKIDSTMAAFVCSINQKFAFKLWILDSIFTFVLAKFSSRESLRLANNSNSEFIRAG